MRRMLSAAVLLCVFVVSAPRPAVGDGRVVSDALLRTLVGHTDQVTSVAVTPDGTKIVSGSKDTTIKVWDLNTGERLHTLMWGTGAVLSVAVSPDGAKIVSGSTDDTVKVWDLNTGALLRRLTGHRYCVNSVAVTPDGGKIVSGSDDGTVKVWDMETGKLLHTFVGPGPAVTSVAATPHGNHLVCGFARKVRSTPYHGPGSGLQAFGEPLSIWDLGGGKTLGSFAGVTGEVASVAVSSDGTRIVSGSFALDEGYLVDTRSGRGIINVWDARTGALLRTLEGGHGPVLSVTVTPDESKLVCGCYGAAEDPGSTIDVWDLNTGALLYTLAGDLAVRSVAVVPDGSKIVSGSSAGTVKVWNMP